jgi:hypothetical protein
LAQWLGLPNAMLAVVFGIGIALVITIGPVRRDFEARRAFAKNADEVWKDTE